MLGVTANRILVVGGTGFIGQHVIRALLSADFEVVVLDISPPTPEFSHLSWFVGDLADSALMTKAVTGCEQVIFLANTSLPGLSNNDLSSEVESHVHQTIKAAEICCDKGVKRFIFASSGGTVYGFDSETPLHEGMPTCPRNAYGVSKLAIEHYLRIIAMMTDMTTVSLRISNPYGEGQFGHSNQGFIAACMSHALSKKTMSIWGDGSVERDFIHVSDVANAFLATCKAGVLPNIINIGSGTSKSLLEVLKFSEDAVGCQIKVQFEPNRIIDVQRNFLDIKRARTKLGWSPTVDMREGLTRTAAWWYSQ